MKYFKKSFLLVLILFVPYIISAKNYSIEKTDIVATISKDGIVHIEETRMYRFDGKYSWVNLKINKKGFKELYNIQVQEGDINFIQSDSKDFGTFTVREKKKSVTIKYYISAQDEERTFTISYDLEGAIVSDDNWSEFFWTFVGSGWKKKNKDITVRLQFEHNVETYQWDYSKEQVDLRNLNDGWIGSIYPNRKRSYVRIRTLFPTSYLNYPSDIKGNINPDIVYSELQLREQEDIRTAEKKESIVAIGRYVYIPLVLLAIFAFFKLYRRNKPDYETELSMFKPDKDQIHPALAHFLIFYGTITNAALMATIFKLIYDGFLKFEYEGKEKKRFSTDRPLIKILPTDRNPNEIDIQFEKELYDFLLEKSEQYIYLDKIFKEYGAKASAFIYKWQKSVANEAKRYEWHVKAASKDIVINILFQLIIAVVGGFLIYGMGPIAIPILLVSVVLMILSITMNHRTVAGEYYFRKFQKHKKALTDIIKEKKEVPSEANWTAFIWALALGNSKKEIEWLVKDWPIESYPNFIFHMPMGNTAMVDVFLVDDLLYITHGDFTGTASVSAASGGGASAGAAGGGGGGGAG